MANHQEHINLIWQIADLLRGPYRPPQYERVMLPMTVLRRFDSVLEPTKDAVLQRYETLKDRFEGEALDAMLNKVSGQRFHNHSPLTFDKLRGAPDTIAKDLVSYINGFSANVRRIFEYFEFDKEIERMDEANILYLVVSRFSTVDLHPTRVTNVEMGLIFENLIRRFNELANETAGDHFTPREVIRLMVNLLFINDDELLTVPGTVRKMLDPTCGTGGMLAEAQSYLKDHHLGATLYAYGQDYNKRAFATAASDMLIKEVAHNGMGENIKFGDSLIDDQFPDATFDYLIANPPFGVDWKRQQSQITREHEKQGYAGRFGAGLPRVNDGALLFLQHMISKFEPVNEDAKKYGSRLAVVFSGSPLFTGGAGSGESNIRRWIIESDWLEAVVALPEQMFYNTGIGTYIWIVTNRKKKQRRGKIQLVDARDYYLPMRRSQGNKRRKIGDKDEGELDQIGDIVRLYGQFAHGDQSKIFDNEDFGYNRVTVERPLRLRYQMTLDDKARFLDACPWLLDDVQAIDKTLDREPQTDWNRVDEQIRALLKKRGSKWKATEFKLFRDVFTHKDANAEAVRKGKAEYEADADLRDFENIPLKDDIDAYFRREVLPHVPDAWMDLSKDKVKVGYEINFNQYFTRQIVKRSLSEINADLKRSQQNVFNILKDVQFTQPIAQGNNHNIITRPSGINWLGDIPAHWNIVQLKFLASVPLQYGANEAAIDINPDHPRFVRITDIDDDGNLKPETFRSLEPELAKPYLLEDGDILLARSGATVGKAFIYRESWGQACFAGYLIRFRCNKEKILPEFFIEFAQSNAYWAQISEGSIQATIPNFSGEKYGSMLIPLPPLDEQRGIISFIQLEMSQITNLRFAAEQMLTLAKDCRSALITAAVTGQTNLT